MHYLTTLSATSEGSVELRSAGEILAYKWKNSGLANVRLEIWHKICSYVFGRSLPCRHKIYFHTKPPQNTYGTFVHVFFIYIYIFYTLKPNK